METKHTKGEWEFIAPVIISTETKEEIALIKAMSIGAGRQNESLANAKLIAAAPELLECCDAVLTAWHSKSSNMQKKEPAYLQQIRNAIKKATE